MISNVSPTIDCDKHTANEWRSTKKHTNRMTINFAMGTKNHLCLQLNIKLTDNFYDFITFYLWRRL